MPVPIPLMNLPTYNIGTFLANAIKSHPVACGKVANAIADLLPKHSEQKPATNAPTGFETAPSDAIQDVSD